MCLLQVLHEPEVVPEAEPPAERLKQAAVQLKRKAPAEENAKPAAGTKRKKVEREVGICCTTEAGLRCHVVTGLPGAVFAANELLELVSMQRRPCHLQLQVAAGPPLHCMASHITAATNWCLTLYMHPCR